MDYFKLDGENYELRRIGVSDVVKLNSLALAVKRGAEANGIELSELFVRPEDQESGFVEKFLGFIMLGLDFAGDEVLSFIKSLIKTPKGEDFTDDIYLADLHNFVKALSEHKDIKSFLGRIQETLALGAKSMGLLEEKDLVE